MISKHAKRTRSVIAERWTCAECKLDGELARVTGRLNDFATIASLVDASKSADFAWSTVDRIMSTSKEFHS